MNLEMYAAELNKSAQKYRKQLLMLPSIGIGEVLPYLTGMPGVTYKQTVGEIFANAQLRPYDGNNNGQETAELYERTLQTYLGSCVELFDPNQLRQTIYAQLVANAGKIQDSEMNKAMLFAIMDSVLSYLGTGIWTATRNDSGTTTAELFNGFDTITATEIANSKISVAKGNYKALTEAITNVNAVDQLKTIYRSTSDELKAKQVKMFVSHEILEAYDDDYLTTVGSAPYNNQFEQRYLLGSGKKCEIVPLSGKSGSSYIHISTKRNMLYGYGNGVENEKIEVRRGDNAFKLQMILAMFFGVEFATLNKKEFFVAKLADQSSS